MATNRTLFRSSITAALFAAGIAFGTTAASAYAPDPKPTPAPSAAAAKVAPVQDATYCLKDNFTGSRIAKTKCRTRSEWIALEGIDPATLAAKK